MDDKNQKSRARSYSYKSNLNAKQVHVVKQEVVKRKMLECVKLGEKVILRIQTKNQMEKVLKRKKLNNLSVIEKVTLKM